MEKEEKKREDIEQVFETFKQAREGD